MSEFGKRTYEEILSQPSVWAEVAKTFSGQTRELSQLWQERFEHVIFTGCGSTYYLSLIAEIIFRDLVGEYTQARPASELVFFPNNIIPADKKTLLVAISRSGETSESVEAIKYFKETNRGKVLSITTDGNSSVAKLSDFVLACEAAQEESIAQTRSFSSMLILAQSFCAHLAGHDTHKENLALPGIVEKLFNNYYNRAKEIGENKDIEKFYYLGSGKLFGVAQEAALKMKEMSLTTSEAFHVLEFRHGPMSMVDKRTMIIGLISDDAASQESKVIKDMRNLRGETLSIAETNTHLVNDIGQIVELGSGVSPWSRPVIYLPLLQLIAYYRSITKGLDPDKPTNLDAVVRLSSLV